MNASSDSVKGFGLVLKKSFKGNIDRWPDCKALWKGLDSSAKQKSFQKSLEAYKQAVVNDPDAKFWMKDVDTWQAKGYRYITQYDLDLINANGGRLPLHSTREGQYFTLTEYYGNGEAAKSFLQLPRPASEYIGRIEFNLADVTDSIRVAFSNNDTDKTLFEFLAVDNPNLGQPGKGLQLLLDSEEPQVIFKAFGTY